jgi:hypothetical protein
MTSLWAPQATQENFFGNAEGARCDEVAGRFTATHLLQYRAKLGAKEHLLIAIRGRLTGEANEKPSATAISWGNG